MIFGVFSGPSVSFFGQYISVIYRWKALGELYNPGYVTVTSSQNSARE